MATFWASVLHLPNKLINTFCHPGSFVEEGVCDSQCCLGLTLHSPDPWGRRLCLALSRWRSPHWPLWFCPQLGHPGWLLNDPCTARREGETVHREHRSPGLGGQGAWTCKWSPSQRLSLPASSREQVSTGPNRAESMALGLKSRAPLSIYCVTLNKSLDLSKLSFPSLNRGYH